MKSAAFRSGKNQIDGVFSRIFNHSHFKARSHNPKGACACREKKISLFLITHTVSKVSRQLQTSLEYRSLYWYKAIFRCPHLVARILQHRCKISSWLMVNKRSNQTVHLQSATKFESLLQDIKNYQPVKLLKYLLHFCLLPQKTTTTTTTKQLLIFLTMLTQTD